MLQRSLLLLLSLEKENQLWKYQKTYGRYHQTVKNFVKDQTNARKRVDKGESRVVSRRSLSRIKRECYENPGQTVKELFDCIGGPNVSRTNPMPILGLVAKPLMANIKPSVGLSG